MNAPQQSSVSDIQEMQHFVIAPGFLTYAGIVVIGAIFAAVWAGPRYGKKNMFVYLSICSFIGGLSVVATQGLGSAILAQFNGEQQFNKWFLYVLFVFVLATLLTEIVYLNKALNIFNAALVTPTYYVIFTTTTIVTSAILFRGFKGSGVQIATVVLGFLEICAGVSLLQLSKSSKDVPDASVFKGDLDQLREVASQQEPESEPKADAIRGTASIIRRLSTPRRNMEEEEARRHFNDRRQELLGPPEDDGFVEWDGLRRRKTLINQRPTMARSPTTATSTTSSSMTSSMTPSIAGTARTISNKRPLPPLGMSQFPEPEPEQEQEKGQIISEARPGQSFLGAIRSGAFALLRHGQWKPLHGEESEFTNSDRNNHHYHHNNSIPRAQLLSPFQPRRGRSDASSRSISWADEASQSSEIRSQRPLSNHSGVGRQFSFRSVGSNDDNPRLANVPPHRVSKNYHSHAPRSSLETVTEEERLGLASGDSQVFDIKEDKGQQDKEDKRNSGKRGRLWSSTYSSNGSTSLEDVTDVTGLVKERYYGGKLRQDSASSFSAPPPPYEEEDHHRRNNIYRDQRNYHYLYPSHENDYDEDYEILPPTGTQQATPRDLTLPAPVLRTSPEDTNTYPYPYTYPNSTSNRLAPQAPIPIPIPNQPQPSQQIDNHPREQIMQLPPRQSLSPNPSDMGVTSLPSSSAASFSSSSPSPPPSTTAEPIPRSHSPSPSSSPSSSPPPSSTLSDRTYSRSRAIRPIPTRTLGQTQNTRPSHRRGGWRRTSTGSVSNSSISSSNYDDDGDDETQTDTDGGVFV